jgi:hypothetical protein
MLSELKARWMEATGEPMSQEMLRLPIKKICKAVLLAEEGVVVVIPKEAAPVISDGVDSMADWDSHKEF